MDQERLTSRIVKPSGPTTAEILMVGEAPGAEEDASGKPFQGQAGQLLNRCLTYRKIPRATIRVDNVFNQRPPKNNVGHYFQDASKTKYTWEAEEHLEKFKKRVLQMPKLNVIVALGDTPLYALTGKKKIWTWRGSVLESTLIPGKKVYPTLHPSGIHRLMNEPEERLDPSKKKLQQNALPLFLIDLDRIKEQSEYPEICRPQRTFKFCTAFHEAMEELEKLKSADLFSVDIETIPTKDGPILWMIGFAPRPDYGFNIPFLRSLEVCWTIDQEIQIWKKVSEIMLNDAKKVFQGGAYDLSILGRYYGIRVADGTMEDTMLCHHASYPYLKKSLATLCSIYTWEPYYKGDGKIHLGSRSDEGEAIYNGKDITVTREILPVTHRNARELGTYEGYQRTMSVMPSLLGMMLKGVKIDMVAKAKLALKFALLAKKYRIKVQRFVDQVYQWPKEINLNSHVQLKNLLYDEMKLPVQRDVKKKTPTSNKEALKKLRKKTKKPIEKEMIGHILEYKKYAKLTSTYTKMEVDDDGRIHTSYGFVSTWRLSSSQSPFGNGGNLQNIPASYTETGRAIRRLFIPDPGMVILCADYSQAEVRVVDWEANNLVAIKAYKQGMDVHWEKCKELFGIPDNVSYVPNNKFVDTITRKEHSLYELRRLAKRTVHAGNYGMGPRMLQSALAVDGFVADFATCKKLIQRFKNTAVFTMQWQRKIRERVKATRKMVSSYDRVRYFMGRMNDNLFRAAYAFSPQNTVGEMMTCAIQRMWEQIPEFHPLLNVHDEIVGQCKREDLDKVIPLIKECMEEEIIINGRPLVIPVDFKMGPSWGDAKEIEV